MKKILSKTLPLIFVLIFFPKDLCADQKKSDSVFDKSLGGKVDKNIPLEITSDTLDFDARARVFVYKKNVTITRGDMRITSDRATGKYDEENKLQLVTCEDNVVITRGDRLSAKSNKAIYDLKTAIIELTESPELINESNALVADKIKVFVDEDRSEAEGSVRVKVIQAKDASKQIGSFGGGIKSADNVPTQAEPQVQDQVQEFGVGGNTSGAVGGVGY